MNNQKSAGFFLLDPRKKNEKSKNYIQKHIKIG